MQFIDLVQLLSDASCLIVQNVVVPAVVSKYQLVFEGSIPTCACFHSENFFVTLHMYVAHKPVQVVQEKVIFFTDLYFNSNWTNTSASNIPKKLYDQEALKLPKISTII